MLGCSPEPTPRERGGPLAHEAYLWQREWVPGVARAVRDHGGELERIVVLAGEIRWVEGRGEWTGVSWDHEVLKALARPPGVAIRIGGYAGPFRDGDAAAGFVRRKARDAVDAARREGWEPSELQIDFDCAESRLEGYRLWVDGLRRELNPLPVVITALPSWLGRRAFADLARAASGYVLQVHSVARPKGPREPFQLCDPDAARRWVEAAGRLGAPFRVALPTYGYRLAFDPQGRYLGASAEGPDPARPPGTTWTEVRADAGAMANLVAGWQADRPESLRGVLWYRLPVDTDRLNWRWATLESVMQGRAPVSGMRFFLEPRGPGRFDVRVANEGSADHAGGAGFVLRWSGADLAGSDAIRGFACELRGSDGMLFTNAICRLPAGEARTIGWLRFTAQPLVELLP